jgi:metal-responsive CopG/Arc/MetJ family transcriptional regulator
MKREEFRSIRQEDFGRIARASLSVSLPVNLIAELKALSCKTYRPMSRLVEAAVNRFLEEVRNEEQAD